MKQADIKRLEKAVEHLAKAQELLDKTFDSLSEQPTEYFNFGSTGTQQTLTSMVGAMLGDVVQQKNYIAGKIRVFKEDYLKRTIYKEE